MKHMKAVLSARFCSQNSLFQLCFASYFGVVLCLVLSYKRKKFNSPKPISIVVLKS